VKLFGLEISRLSATSPTNPALDLISTMRQQLLAGIESAAGANVNDETVLSLSSAFACMRVIAEDVGVTPLMLYRRVSDGVRRRESDLRLYELLHDLPNPEMTAQTFKEVLCYQMLLPSGGFAAAEIEYDDNGNVRYLWPLLSKDVEMLRGTDGRIYYRVHIPTTGQTINLPGYKVLYIPGIATTGYNAKSPAKMAANVVGLSLAIEKFAALHFANGGWVKDYLKTPGKLSDAAGKNLRDTWVSGHGSLNAAQRTAILEEGMEYVTVMQELGKILPPDVRAQQVIEVCRLYRMQPNKVQEYGRATWANAEQMNISHYRDCLLPWFTRWEQACNWKLRRDSQKDLYFEFQIDNFLRGDYKTRTEGYATLIQNGLATRNEIRALENLPPVDGGDELFVPLNMAPLSKIMNGEIQPSGSATPGSVSK
jgi:HK97 family phage portal protein